MLRKRPPKYGLLLVLSVVLLIPSHAFAYGDPSGGYLFQMLTPLAAVLWGGWLIFAGAIRKRVTKIARRIGFSAPEEGTKGPPPENTPEEE